MAKSKIITYDLCNSGKNYSALYEYIKSFDKWARITESVWFISSDKTCSTIRDEANKIIDLDDRFFVADLTGAGAWRNVRCKNDYLLKNL